MAKNGNNEGSVYKDKKGRWRGVVTLPTVDKKVKKKYFYGKTRKEVSDKVNNVLNQLRNNTYYEPCKTTLFDWLNIWLETYSKQEVRPTTYINYETYIHRHIKDTIGGFKLCDISTLIIQQFYNDLYNRGLSANTVKHYHALLHRAFKYAIKMDILSSNPTEKTERPKLSRYAATYYNEKELEELFKAFEGDRMELVVYIAAYYGLRRSEICGLKWDAIDFDKKTITVCRKIVSKFDNGKEEIVCQDELKTEASKRTLPLIPKIEKMLRERMFLEVHYSRLLKKGYNHDYDGFVCRDNLGELITPSYVTDHFKHIIDKNNMKHLRFHDLRHSCASLLLANNIPMKAIQEWLGHSTYTVTANFYSHLDYQSKIESAETIARVLGGGDSE